MEGVIDLFGGLEEAARYLGDTFWRGVFKHMAGDVDRRNRVSLERIENKLCKQDWNLPTDDDKLRWMAELVLDLANKQALVGHDVSLRYLKRRALKAAEDDGGECRDNGPTTFDPDRLQRTVGELIEQAVLLPGFSPKCPRCGYRTWYHVRDVATHISCRGCTNEFTLPAQPEWRYRLNSLVRDCVAAHGTVPVILALRQLESWAKTSFLYSPSLNLYDKTRKAPVAEVDLVCLVDGEFVIGEVKQSVRRFGTSDFTRIAAVAELIKPDIVQFSAMGDTTTPLVDERVDSLKDQLRLLEVDVRWRPIYDVAGPRLF